MPQNLGRVETQEPGRGTDGGVDGCVDTPEDAQAVFLSARPWTQWGRKWLEAVTPFVSLSQKALAERCKVQGLARRLLVSRQRPGFWPSPSLVTFG